MDMITEDRWFVIGGVFTDGTFSKIEPNESECHGQYATEKEAEIVRDGITRRNLDICWHKVWTTKGSFVVN
jgi:hypothetical protein